MHLVQVRQNTKLQKKTLKNKYDNVELQDLDDSIEFAANEYIVNCFRS